MSTASRKFGESSFGASRV